MAEDKKLTQLIINELTKDQYKALLTGDNVNEDEIYVITDDEVEIKSDGATIVGYGTTANPLSISPKFVDKVNTGTEAIAELQESIKYKVETSSLGVVNGVATLDENAKVPMSQINDSLLGNVQYQGLYDVSTNTPNLDTVATKGHYYIISAAGERFDIKFEVGDWIISNGTSWDKVDNTDAVSSVNGRTGNVVITVADIDFPDQTDNAGKFLMTDGANISWGNAIKNEAEDPAKDIEILTAETEDSNILIGRAKKRNASGGAENVTSAIAIGSRYGGSYASATNNAIAIGKAAEATGSASIALGFGADAWTPGSIAIGNWAHARAAGAIQLNARYSFAAENNEEGTFKVCLGPLMGDGGNYKLLDIDGTIPTDRYTTTPTDAGTYVPKLTIAEDGTATREWGASLPDQTDNAGKFLTTDGTNVSWGEALVNHATTTNSLYVGSFGDRSTNAQYSVALGINAATSIHTGGTAIGFNASVDNNVGYGTAVGYSAIAGAPTGKRTGYNISIGANAISKAKYAIQLGTGSNSDDNTFKVGNENGNFEMMSADGTIPTERLASNGTAGQILKKAESGMVWSDLLAEHVNITIGSETTTVKSAIETINSKIPEAASSTNLLVDKATLDNAINSFEALPDKTNNNGKVLATDGTDAYWTDAFVKPTDYATDSKAGISKVNAANGIAINSSNTLAISQATVADIEAKTNQYNPITPAMLDYAVKAGILANSMQLSTEEKLAAQNWLGFGTITMRTWK